MSGSERRIDRSQVVFEYSATAPPCARIEPGETVVVETQWAFGEHNVQSGDTLGELDDDKCDPLTGPLFVTGAEPGDALAVTIHAIDLVGQGGQGIIPGLGILDWSADVPVEMFTPEAGTVEWLRGIRIPIRPNLGCIGVAPAGAPVPSVWPGDHGGNLDNRYCAAGATVSFPVSAPGALLVMGDAHQVQGDGELCGVAPETAADVTISCEVLKGHTIARPQLRSDSSFMTMASAVTLEEAIRLATADFIDVLVAEKGFSRDEAYLLIAMEAHAEICQVVNPLMTARVTMSRPFFDAL